MAAANANVPDRCFNRHGRWKSENAKDGYIKDKVESRLRVSKSLGLYLGLYTQPSLWTLVVVSKEPTYCGGTTQ